MSIANLLVPNDLNIFANSVTSSGLIQGENIYRIDYVNTGTQAIPSGVMTAVNFTANLYSSNFPATLPISSYTAPLSGIYSISYTVSISNSNGIGYCQAYIKRASAGYGYGVCSSRYFEASALTPGPPVSGITLATDGIPLGGSARVPLNQGEQVQLIVFQNSGVSQNLTSSAPNSQLITIDYCHGL